MERKKGSGFGYTFNGMMIGFVNSLDILCAFHEDWGHLDIGS